MTTSSSLAAFGSNIRWGILSAGKISSDFAKAIAITEGAECAAVAARNGDKAADFAKMHNIPTSYGSYDELLNDPNIDVVYVGSIADQHAKMAKQSLLAGKPTVVEKPLTLSATETTQIVQLAKKQNIFLTEGMWTRFFPAMKKVSDVIASGEIGDVVNVQGDFGWSNVDCPFPDDRIWNQLSGGMTYDIGMYMAHLGQVAYPDSEVEMIQAMSTFKNDIDQTVLANIMYTKNTGMFSTNDETGTKGMLQFYVTGAANTEERVTIQGSMGRIVLDSPAHVPEKVRVFRDAGRGKSTEEVFDFPLPDDSYTTWYYPGSIGFTHEIKGVCDALRAGKKECPQFTWNNSIQLATVIDEIICQTRGSRTKSKTEIEHNIVEEEKVSA
jgi:dihydrodiol dehydrogenase / D-xylose 1-dehydrogenase (NADP)